MHPEPPHISPALVEQLMEEGSPPSGAASSGLLHPGSTASALHRLASGPRGAGWGRLVTDLARALSTSPDPDLAASSLQALDEETDLSWLEPGELSELLRVLGASPFLGQLLVRHPGWLRWLLREEGRTPGIEPPEVGEAAESEALLLDLNRWKRRGLLGIGAPERM